MTDVHDNLVDELVAAQDDALGGHGTAQHNGEVLITALHRILKGAAFYDREHPTFTQMAHAVVLAVKALRGEADALRLKIGRDACFANDTLIRCTADAFAAYTGFLQAMHQRKVGLLRIGDGFTETVLIEFILLLRHPEADDAAAINARLEALGIDAIVVEAAADEDLPDPTDTEALKRRARGVYFSTIGVCKELVDGARHHALNLRKAKRLMLSAVNLVVRDESALLGLASIKNFDDYTFNHSVNVAIYAMALGNRLGLPPKYLNYLGMIGLFHDIGKMEVPLEILHKTGALAPEEWEEIRRHPLRGAEMILRMRGWDPVSAALMEGTFEHHLKYDLTGYPRVLRLTKPGLFGRIIALADCYDAMARPRVYRSTPYITERILATFLKEAGRQFDPVLVKVFINMVGVHPLGALVLLNTYEIGIVCRVPDDPALIACPQVCLLERTANGYRKGNVVDLAAVDADGNHPRRIIETLNPQSYEINVEEFFFSV
jgi:putative nucleotidyltransferase with HDIG domain